MDSSNFRKQKIQFANGLWGWKSVNFASRKFSKEDVELFPTI
jgi:hypothetical protein